MKKNVNVLLSAAVLALLGSTLLGDEGLELRLRAHAKQITFGDPIYLEWTLTNRGAAAVSVPPLTWAASHVSILAHDRELDLTTSVTFASGAGGDFSSIKLPPGGALKEYGIVLLPTVGRSDHPFWKPFQSGKDLGLSCSFARRRGVIVVSPSVPLRIEARDANQAAVLARWRGEEFNPFLGPTPNDLVSLFPKSNLNRSQTTAVREALETGEIADLLFLTQQLQEMHELAEDNRGHRTNHLIKWLLDLPEIKREALMNATRGVAAAYQLDIAEAELKRLIDPRPNAATSPP